VRSARKTIDPEFERNEVLVKTDHGARDFAVGDRLLFTRNDRDLGVRNGMLATVTNANTDELTVRFDQDDEASCTDLEFKPSEFSSVDHGYAVTIHRAQGCKVDNTFVLSSRTMDEHLTYVAMTRHRKTMQIYTALDIGMTPKRENGRRMKLKHTRKRN
jgi:ATP-dependent exoDNAse (exonuclease V) alpha subunit